MGTPLKNTSGKIQQKSMVVSDDFRSTRPIVENLTGEFIYPDVEKYDREWELGSGHYQFQLSEKNEQ